MPESGVRRMSPTAEPTGEKDALPATDVLLAQSLLDRDLAERVERALRATGYGPLRCIEVSVQAQLVILAGRVPSYYLKQIAQTAAQAVPGTHHVHNNLEVI